MQPPIMDLVRKTDKLPTLPTIAVEILRLTRSSEIDIEKLAKIVEKEPALTITILKAANSPIFGLARKVANVKQAMLLLGLRTVRVLALSFSLVDVLAAEDKFDYPAYWRRSLITAVAARLLAQAVRSLHAEDVFVCGLLSDVGMIAAWRCARNMYAPVLERWAAETRPLAEIEKEMLGVTHAAMGRELLEMWGLPETLYTAVAAHHGEGLEALPEALRPVCLIVRSSSDIAGLFSREIMFSEMDRIKEECKANTGVSDENLEELLKVLGGHVREMAEILAIRVGRTMNYAELQAEASSQLAQLSIQAEVERVASSAREAQARKEADVHEQRVKALESQLNSMEDTAKRAEAMTYSVKMAAERQRQMLPAKLPTMSSAEMSVIYRPVSEISGDFYDFVEFDENNMGLIIGDVSGHGIEAGMLVGMAKTILVERLKEQPDPYSALCRANVAITSEMGRESFVTACVAVFNSKDRLLTFASAGHPPVILTNKNRQPKMQKLDARGFSLGLAEGEKFGAALKRQTLSIQAEDMFLFYTDGLTEAENRQGQDYGSSRLGEILQRTAGLSPKNFLDLLMFDWTQFCAGVPQSDDVSAICMRFQ